MHYQFADCQLDTEQRILLRQEQPVRLQPRAFELLAYLLAHHLGATEIASTYSRARELCRQVDDISHTFPVLYGLVGYHHLRQEWPTTRALAEEIFTLAQRLGEPGYLLMGHRAMGEVLYWTGAFVPARTHVEQGIAIYDTDQHGAHALIYGSDPLVNCRLLAAHVLWLLGYPDQALQMSEDANHVERVLSLLTASASAGGNLVTDAQIASLAMAHRAVVHTADRDFLRFPQLICHYPLD